MEKQKAQQRRRPHPSANQSRPAVRIHRNTDRYWQKRKQNNEEKELQEKQKANQTKENPFNPIEPRPDAIDRVLDLCALVASASTLFNQSINQPINQ